MSVAKRSNLKWGVLPLLALLLTTARYTYAKPPRFLPNDNPPRQVSKAEVATAVRAMPESTVERKKGLAWLRSNADAVANLAYFESGLHPGIYNGSCCYGILQMTGSNIRSYTHRTATPYMYRQWSLQDQVNLWGKLTADGLNRWSVSKLTELQKQGGKFDGRTVDGNLIMACIQLGTGNCATMVRNKRCSAFADRNGTTICKMADKIAGSGGGAIAGGGTGALEGGDGFSGCLRGAQLPSPEFVGPPSPDTETTPDFKQEQPTAIASNATGSQFENECIALIERDLKDYGAEKMKSWPVEGDALVTSRYGVVRDVNKGAYRTHAGLDMRGVDNGKKRRLLAADDGKVIAINSGNTHALLIRRNTPENHVIAYHHPSRTDVKLNQSVTHGEPVGVAGNYFINRTTKKQIEGIPIHLHFEYYIPADQRKVHVGVDANNEFKDKTGSVRLPVLRDPGGTAGIGGFGGYLKAVATDPSPFMKGNIPMVAGLRGKDRYGKDSYSQYCITRSVSGYAGESLGRYAAAQEYIDNGGPCNDETDDWLPDTDGWGEIDKFLDMSPDGEYDYRSYLERALDVARHRFSSVAWHEKIMHLSSLKLWQDYLLARRTELWLDLQLNQKRAHINHLLAVLTAQRGQAAAEQAAAVTTIVNTQAAQ
ncbi:MAG: M23 family metallopeptidase [Actinomycetaceae bacterium]|nr:M23 family metallopeptidase [Actinomycetaceae bacterium]